MQNCEFGFSFSRRRCRSDFPALIESSKHPISQGVCWVEMWDQMRKKERNHFGTDRWSVTWRRIRISKKIITKISLSSKAVGVIRYDLMYPLPLDARLDRQWWAASPLTPWQASSDVPFSASGLSFRYIHIECSWLSGLFLDGRCVGSCHL